jgi:hypothetical protein
MDGTTPETNDQRPPVEAPPPAPAPGKRERKAPSAEAAKLAAERKRLKRAMEKMLASNDAAAIADAAAKLAGAGGDTAAGRPAEASEPAALEKAEPEKKPEPAKGPTPEEVEAMAGLAAGIVSMVAEPLAGTDFDPMKPRPNPLGGEPVVMATELTKALAPVLAKHLPNMVTTAEGNLMLTVALWLAPPALAVAKRKMLGDAAPANVDGAGQKAA